MIYASRGGAVADVVLFVHGTGVRETGWAGSFALVKKQLHGLDPAVKVKGCFWGGTEGAVLHADGASIPQYAETRKRGEPTSAEEDLAQWAILYTDPWYEIRLLSDLPPDDDGEVAPGEKTASDLLSDQIADFAPSVALGGLLALHDLGSAFDAACTALRDAPEFGRATENVTDATLNEYRKAVARALVAFTVVSAEEAGVPPVDGATRDEIVAAVTEDLNAYGMGLAAELTRPFKGIALSIATQLATRKRGAVTDATTPMAGDIIRYQARGAGIRRYLRQVIADAVAGAPGGSVALIGHSLGGIACVETLAEAPVPGVSRLVTVGSQAPFLYEIDALSSLRYGEPLPGHFPAWLNIYDTRDILSYIGAGVFRGRVTDQPVDNGQPFPSAHTTYWRNKAVWQHIGGFLA